MTPVVSGSLTPQNWGKWIQNHCYIGVPNIGGIQKGSRVLFTHVTNLQS